MKICARVLFLAGCFLCLLHMRLVAQDGDGLYKQVLHFPGKLVKKVNGKASTVNDKLVKQTDKYLSRLAGEERKLKAMLAQKDSLAASRIFDDALQQYATLQAGMRHLAGTSSNTSGIYVAYLDSMQTALRFVGNTESMLKKAPELQNKLKDALGNLNGLQSKFSRAEEIKRFVEERKEFLQQHLGRYGLADHLQAFRQQAYYYRAQVDEYKQLLSDPSRLEAKAFQLLGSTEAFKDFFRKNSQLAAMFAVPVVGSNVAGPSGNTSFAGMQTRASVQHDLEQKFGSGADVQQLMSRQVQSARSQLSDLKEQVLKAGGSSSEEPLPDFKPNRQKTKSLLGRLEWGSNLQTVKANRFFPSTSDLGLSLGYKLNDKSTVGIGGSYKMGWGSNIRHVSITHQGVGVRSFLDYKLKGSIWLAGGAEMNYRSSFDSFEILKSYSAWQKSALVGLSKKYQVSRKLKGNMQLLYDLLWKQQVPRTQALLFRIGYTFK